MLDTNVSQRELIDTLRQTAYALGSSDLDARLAAHRTAMQVAERAEVALLRQRTTCDMRAWEANEFDAPANERFCGGGL